MDHHNSNLNDTDINRPESSSLKSKNTQIPKSSCTTVNMQDNNIGKQDNHFRKKVNLSQKIHQSEKVIGQQIYNSKIHYHQSTPSHPTVLSKGPIVFHVPNPIRSFHGRENELANLARILSEKKIAVISGMAGIGKTELAKHYTHDNSAAYGNNLIWINAETSETLQKSFDDLHSKLQLQECTDNDLIVNEVYTSLKLQKVLFVFDNACNRKSLQKYFPSAVTENVLKIHILITTQYSNWGCDIDCIKLESLSEKSALDIFKTVLRDNYKCTETTHFLNLAKYLNFIPLALQISAAYVNERFRSAKQIHAEFSIAKYLSKLSHEECEFLDESFPQSSTNDYNKTIYISVKMSLENVQKINKSEAVDMLYFCSYLNSSNISEEHLKILCSEQNLDSILTLLVDYSFIVIEKKTDDFNCRQIRMHRLVQGILRLHQRRNNIEANYYEQLLELVVRKKFFSNFSNSHRSSILLCSKENTDLSLNFYKKLKPSLLLYFTCKYKSTKDISLRFLSLLVVNGCFTVVEKIFQVEGKRKVRYLIEKLNVETSLDLTASFNQKGVVNLLIKNSAKMKLRNYHGNTALHQAVANGYVEIVKLLLKNNASTEVQNNNGDTALHIAAISCCSDIIQTLIDSGADVNAQNNLDESALHRVLYNNFTNESQILQCVKLLVKEGKANVNLRNDLGLTPLHIAAWSCLPNVIKYLIKKGADVHMTDIFCGNTAIFYVVYLSNIPDSQKISTARVLVKAGSQLDVTDNYGLTPAQRAMLEKCFSLARYLESFKNK